MARPDKAAAVAELTESFRGSSAALLTEYRGLTVAQLTKLRQTISEHATYAVVKNTLTDIAAREAGVVSAKRVLDSTPLYDAVATQDTVTMIRAALVTSPSSASRARTGSGPSSRMSSAQARATVRTLSSLRSDA